MYYLCSENKGADQPRGYREADLRFVFAYAKSRFSHNETHMATALIRVVIKPLFQLGRHEGVHVVDIKCKYDFVESLILGKMLRY